MRDKFKVNIFMVMPAVIITIIGLVLWPINAVAIDASGAINLINLLFIYSNYFIIIIRCACYTQYDNFSTIRCSYRNITWRFTFVESFKIIHRGMG